MRLSVGNLLRATVGFVLLLLLALVSFPASAAALDEPLRDGEAVTVAGFNYDDVLTVSFRSGEAAALASAPGTDRSEDWRADHRDLVGNYDPSAERVAPRVADDFVYLAPPQRCTHILDGDATGGGHRWPGAPDKTPFSQGWGDDQIMHHVSDIATDPSLTWNWTKGSPSGYTRAGDPSRASVFGVRDGFCIKVVVEPAGEGIITAHPSPGSC